MSEDILNPLADIATEEVAQPVAKVKIPEKIITAKGKKRAMKQMPAGRAFIHASVNNTIVTITDPHGNTLIWASAGNSGFRGPKKATPYAASVVVKKVAEKAAIYGIKDLNVTVSGIGNGRDGALRALNANGFNILSINDTTPVPHNGCRPRRARRV